MTINLLKRLFFQAITFGACLSMTTSAHAVVSKSLQVQCVQTYLEQQKGVKEGRGSFQTLNANNTYVQQRIRYNSEIVQDILGAWVVSLELESENFEKRYFSTAFNFNSPFSIDVYGTSGDITHISIQECSPTKGIKISMRSKDWLTLQTTTFLFEMSDSTPFSYSFWRSSVGGSERGPLIEQITLH